MPSPTSPNSDAPSNRAAAAPAASEVGGSRPSGSNVVSPVAQRHSNDSTIDDDTEAEAGAGAAVDAVVAPAAAAPAAAAAVDGAPPANGILNVPPLPPDVLPLPAPALPDAPAEGAAVGAAAQQDGGEDNEFQSCLTCPITQVPPTDAVWFLIQDAMGRSNLQVFERRALYMHIATMGMGRARRYVRHPIANGRALRVNAMALVRRVPAATQDIINAERRRRGMTMDVVVVTEEDRAQYQSMLTTLRTRYVLFLCIVHNMMILVKLIWIILAAVYYITITMQCICRQFV